MERSIAAEARRQKRLSKGAERLRSIVGGNALSESFGDKSIIATCDIGRLLPYVVYACTLPNFMGDRGLLSVITYSADKIWAPIKNEVLC